MAAAVASPINPPPLPVARRPVNHADPLDGLRALVDHPSGKDQVSGQWRWNVVKHLGVVRDLLVGEATGGPGKEDSALMARHECVRREQAELLRRLVPLKHSVLESGDLGATAAEIERFLAAVTRHVQRRHDLAYDAVNLELGGSE